MKSVNSEPVASGELTVWQLPHLAVVPLTRSKPLCSDAEKMALPSMMASNFEVKGFISLEVSNTAMAAAILS